MPRIHAFELEDQPWCPAVIRDAATDYLRTVQAVAKPYQPVTSLLSAALQSTGTHEVIDLCSGGAGSWPYLLPALAEHNPGLKVCLTDKFPNIPAFKRTQALLGKERISFAEQEVDARAVAPQLVGFRSMFTALHHFRPDDARAILANAASGSTGFAAFECTSRSFRALLMVLCTPLFVLLLTPWIRPFSWTRLFWTYVIPAVPFLACFDGVISCLRTYSIKELEALSAAVGHESIEWQIGQVSGALLPLTYIIGIPKVSA